MHFTPEALQAYQQRSHAHDHASHDHSHEHGHDHEQGELQEHIRNLAIGGSVLLGFLVKRVLTGPGVLGRCC